MAQTKMYAGMTNSPKTSLASDITANATTITVVNSSVLPAAPNLAVIGSTADAEVIVYSGKNGNDLTGVLRGQGGTVAQSWIAATSVARNFTIIDYDSICDNIRDLEARKRNTADKIDASTQMTGVLPVANGGTGKTDVSGIKSTLGLGSLAYKNQASLANDVSGTLPIANGGTGLTASPSMLTNLASTSAANVMAASPRPGITGTLGAGNGGTGQTSLQATRNAMGLGNTTGALPVANGGTGATSAANARTNLGAAASSHTHSSITDRSNSTATYLNYGAAAVTSCDYLAAWNGYELRGISKSSVKSLLGLGSVTAIANRPDYQISSTDLTPGSSSLTTGALYFVYE